MKVIKNDKDNSDIKLDEVEFDLLDKEGNVVKHFVTNEKGEAVIEGINTGEYTLKETKTKEEA